MKAWQAGVAMGLLTKAPASVEDFVWSSAVVSE